MRIELGDWAALSALATQIRWQVFVIEQGVPEDMELDESDAVSLHALAFDEHGRALATGRLLPDGHIGRVAVLRDHRGGGIGSLLMKSLMAAARERGHAQLLIHAQTSARPFYERLGFAICSDEFEEAGIPHLSMQCDL